MEDNKIGNNQSDAELPQKLANACLGLVWSSETDFLWQVICPDLPNVLNSQVLLQHYNYAPKTKIETTTLESFFAPATVDREWHDELEKNQVRRYRLLQKLLQDNLSDIRVYLVGEIEIDVYILGKSCDKPVFHGTKKQSSRASQTLPKIIGLSTKIVET